MVKLVRAFTRLSSQATRTLSTSAIRCAPSAAPTEYPFSSTVITFPTLATPPPLSTSLLRTLNLHLTSQHPHAEAYTALFSRRDPNRLLPGSVVTVTSYTSAPTAENPSPSTNTFSGVLIAIRRRHAGRDTSIRLRNLVGRTGVEVAYKVFSPMVKEIKVVSRAADSGPAVVGKDGKEGQRKKPALKASKRAKMYFVRDQPNRCVAFLFHFCAPTYCDQQLVAEQCTLLARRLA